MADGGVKGRPVSTTSSQLSISDRMTDTEGNEEDNLSLRSNLLAQASSSCSSSLNLQRQSVPVARTTTISTIAMESNTAPPGSKGSPTRLVIALLQTPHRGLLLKVIELNPPLLKLPDNLPDAEDFLKNHNQVIKNLQSKQSPVEELLRQADSLIATQKPRAEVYAAMADSLGQTWKDLNGILEERRLVIQLAFNAHKNISECLQKMDQVHSEYSKINYLGPGTEDLSAVDFLKKLKADRAEILKRVAKCLECCDQLLNKIAEYNFTVDSRDLVLLKDVEYANRQVNRWLERLHDRRVILEEKLRNRKEQLEEYSDNSKYENEIKQMEDGMKKFIDFSLGFDFGDSVIVAERRKEELSEVITQLKTLQEQALSTAKRLEDAEYQRAKFYQRHGLKNRIFEVLGQINDLLTESLDLDSSLSDAITFFKLADTANAKLDSFSSKTDPLDTAKSELNRLTFEALSKGQIVLDTYGWDSSKNKGVKFVHDNLLKKKDALLEEIEHLEVLDEYNDFLANVNQTYQNILNIETSTVRQQITIPVSLEQVHKFKSTQEKILEEVSTKLGLESLMNKLQNIYPDLSEEEKCATEGKINELKSLSNLIVELIMQRISLSAEWLKILEIYKSARELSTSQDDRSRVKSSLDQIILINESSIKRQLQEINQSDHDLITSNLEEEVERIIKELRNKLESSAANERIREICHKYKVKLDHHLLGDSASQSPPQYYPVLSYSDVLNCLQVNKSKVTCLTHLIQKIIKPKLEFTLGNFFQPFVTSFRQELLDVQQDLSKPQEKTQEEADLERYCDRLKESYVRVTKEIESYLGKVLEVCQHVENRLNDTEQFGPSVEKLESDLIKFDSFREEISDKIRRDINPRLDKLLQTIRQEEPPIEGEKETEVLRIIMAHLGHDEELDGHRDDMTRKLTDKLIQTDLSLISGQLQELIEELDHPANYGDNLSDAKMNLDNFERFERTIELLREKLSKMLVTAGIPESDEKAGSVKDKLEELTLKRKKRKELIVLSLDYFRLIQLSNEHYNRVNTDLEKIRQESKDPEIQIQKIEELLQALRGIKDQEAVQENRLVEIERISKIIFANAHELSDKGQHKPLRQKNHEITGELERVESDLTELLGFIKSRCESTADIPQKTAEIPPELLAMEQLILPQTIEARKSPSQEMFTQTTESGPQQQQVISTSSLVELRELQTLSVMQSLRQSLSPVPPVTVEKETQFESEEETQPPEKVDRDTDTQTIEEHVSSAETQTEGIQVLSISTATETMEDITEVALPLRPVSREYNDPMFIQPLKDVVVNEGDPVVLECRATGQVHKLLWLKDGMEITNNPDYMTDFVDESVARLSIDEVFHEDSAIFTCRAVGGENQSVIVETSGKLTVREPSTTLMQPPKFLSHPPISLGVHAKPHNLQLKVEGNPLPTVQWFKNGQCIDTSPDYIITFNNGLCKVQFDELLKELDEGIYTCIAVNKIGDAETHIELQIKEDAALKKGARQKPKIIRALPKSIMGRAGHPVKLECEFESATECNLLWWKDDSNVLTSTNSAAEMRTSGNTAILSFNEVYPADSGKYTVLIRNAVGEVKSECFVTVKGLLPAETSDDSELNVSDIEVLKPSVKMHLKDAQVGIGDSLRLDCVIVGHPEPEVIWYRNSTPLKESPNHHLLFQGDRCSLIIKKVAENDQGKYIVTAVNNGGEVTSNCEVRIRDVAAPIEEKTSVIEPPKFLKIIQDDMVTAGDKFRFVVELAPPSNQDTQVSWWKNNKKIEASDGVELLHEGNTYSLQFNQCNLTDKGNYMAKAINAGGDAKCFACLIVKENLETQQVPSSDQKPEPSFEQPRKLSITRLTTKPPKFVVPLDGRMCDEGDTNVSLKCVIDANPPACLIWVKNNSVDPIIPSPNGNIDQRYNEKTGDVDLIIKNVGVADGGRYTCTASNDFGVASSVADLVVKKTMFPPVFSKRLQSLTLDEGKRLYLEVDVYGKPACKIIWQLNDLPVPENSEFVLKSDTPTRYSLAVSKVSVGKHDGDYKVIAVNEAGEAFSSCHVGIIGQMKLICEGTESKVLPPIPPKPKIPFVQEIQPTHSVTSIIKHEEFVTDSGQMWTHQEHQSMMTSSDELKYIKPSKFVPEKMRESDYESDFESSPIPPKWAPTTMLSAPIPPTTSAFVPATSAQISFVPSTSLMSTAPQPSFGNQVKRPDVQRPIPPPKPQQRLLSPLPPVLLPQPEPLVVQQPVDLVKSIVKSWPPQYQDTPVPTVDSTKFFPDGGDHTPNYSRLTLGVQDVRPRSPTPNREAIEMDKLWSKPIRFSSPSKFGPSPVSSPPPLSPYLPPSNIQSPVPPSLSPCQRGIVFSPVTSPIPPLQQSSHTIPIQKSYSPNFRPVVPPKPKSVKSPLPHGGPGSGDIPTREPLYYVSVVSTPSTTPIPSAISPTPEVSFTESSSFHERREFFEQSSSSYSAHEETTSSSCHQSSSSKGFVKHPAAGDFSLLDKSMLPPPGEAPEFLYAPPLPRKSSPGIGLLSPKAKAMFEFSEGSSSSTSTTVKSYSLEKQQHTETTYEVHIASYPTQLEKKPDAPQIDTGTVRPYSTAVVPYIKPSKFTPQLDYASSLEKDHSYDKSSVPMRPKWNPEQGKVTLTTWKRVPYEPPQTASTLPRRKSLTFIVDKRMQDLNQKFKDNIGQMTQGLCYNKMDRKVSSDLEPSGDAKGGTGDPTTTSVEANPLIYFKYDFGYEFGIADPKSVIRASSEPPRDIRRSLPSSTGTFPVDGSGVIHLPIIHEKTNK